MPGPEEVEHHLARRVGLLDVHEVADAVEHLAAAVSGMYGSTFSGGVPQPISSISAPRIPRNGIGMPGSASASTPAATARTRRSASTGRSSTATRRRTRTRRRSPGAAASRTAAAGSSARGGSRARRSCPALCAGGACADGRASRRARSPSSCSARVRRRRECALVRDAVHVDEVGEAERLGVGELVISAPPLECPTTGTVRPGLDVVEHGSASRMSASHEYSAACSLSPWPRWSQPTTRQPPAASLGANTSKVRAKSKPPCTSEQRRAAASPHSWTAMRTPFATSSYCRSGRSGVRDRACSRRGRRSRQRG